MNGHAHHRRPLRLTASLVALGLTSLPLAGCMTTRMEESKNARTGIEQGERIVILEASYHNGNETEDDFVACVSKTVQKGRKGLSVYPDQVFIDALFPWFEPRTVPQAAGSLADLLQRPGVSERSEASGVRAIVWVTGDTERASSGGSLSCAVAPGGGGCFGLAWWENDSSYEAAIWDIREGKSAGQVSTDVQGTSVIPAVIVPVPIIARTKAAACKGLARELKNFISDSGPL
ncbi:MAG: hypothetical protein ACE5G3_08410 [Gammaproteobacteria bacterium]